MDLKKSFLTTLDNSLRICDTIYTNLESLELVFEEKYKVSIKNYN